MDRHDLIMTGLALSVSVVLGMVLVCVVLRAAL